MKFLFLFISFLCTIFWYAVFSFLVIGLILNNPIVWFILFLFVVVYLFLEK